MPDQRLHRGSHPADRETFSPAAHLRMRAATADLSLLLSRGYGRKSALKLVGDRYALLERQRQAVARCACPKERRDARLSRQVGAAELAGSQLHLDGFNVLTTVEAALAGGIILVGDDGCYRDLASMHGSFRTVSETATAAQLIGRRMAELGVTSVCWYLDRPVSNSGQLRERLAALATQHAWPWTIVLVPDPDPVLAALSEIVATADRGILDECGRWFNLAQAVVSQALPEAWIYPLGAPADEALSSEEAPQESAGRGARPTAARARFSVAPGEVAP